jgi:hypothetical protein
MIFTKTWQLVVNRPDNLRHVKQACVPGKVTAADAVQIAGGSRP